MFCSCPQISIECDFNRSLTQSSDRFVRVLEFMDSRGGLPSVFRGRVYLRRKDERGNSSSRSNGEVRGVDLKKRERNGTSITLGYLGSRNSPPCLFSDTDLFTNVNRN